MALAPGPIGFWMHVCMDKAMVDASTYCTYCNTFAKKTLGACGFCPYDL